MTNAFSFSVVSVKQLPTVLQFITMIYGDKANVDTEGDSKGPADTHWTCLNLCLRPISDNPLVEVTRSDGAADVVEIESVNEEIAHHVAKVLADYGNGKIVER